MGKITKRFLAVLFLLFLVFGYPVLQAAADDLNWPTKSITMLVPWSAGGGSDLCVRTLMPFVEKELGVRITVVNQTGANGWIAWTELAKSKPDGYTMSQLNIPAFYSGYLDPQQKRKENLDSFLPIANQISDWGTMVIKKGDPRFSSAKELIEYAKENELLAGDAGKGSNKHLVTENIKKHFNGIKLTAVHQKGWNDNYAALLGGHIDVGWGSVGETLQAYIDGEVDILCVFAPSRSPALPEVPTFKELELGAINSPSDRGFMLPAGVDKAIYEKICNAFEKAINNPEHVEKMKQLGMIVNYIGGSDYITYAKENEEVMRSFADVMGWK
jgi:tripartite-type tricarboxylate transporter receptor subunit TctC